jgi:hypothetical protein
LIEYVTVYALLIIGSVVGVGLLIFGSTQIARRNIIYHRQANGQRPTIEDFPLFGAYKIDAHERVTAHLRNDQHTPPHVKRARGTVQVEVMPEASAAEQYATYRATYTDPSIGRYLHAGTIAFDSLEAVSFTPDIEYGHRMALRQPIEEYVVRAGRVTQQPALFETTYDIDSSVMYTDSASGQRFVLDFRPELKEHDSYTLQLRFRWLGNSSRMCRLNECRLIFDPDLGKIVRVEQGRRVQHNDGEDIVWRNLLFQDGSLTLSVSFSQPILNKPILLKGAYEVDVDGALSGLVIRPEMVWNALGRRATERTQPSIRASSIMQSNITIATSLLSQEHELVRKAIVPVPCPPDYELVRRVAQVLVNCEVDIQRIEQAAPRLDPRGTLQTELRYWDIIGRRYERKLLEAVDVHVVISGYVVADQQALDAPQSQIDVRVRCLHDPRDMATPRCATLTRNIIKSELERIFALVPNERSI